MFKPKTLKYRTGRSSFVYIFFQASSGREMDQNKGLLQVLYFTVFGLIILIGSSVEAPLEATLSVPIPKSFSLFKLLFSMLVVVVMKTIMHNLSVITLDFTTQMQYFMKRVANFEPL